MIYEVYDDKLNLIWETKRFDFIKEFAKTHNVYAISKFFEDKKHPMETKKVVYKPNKPFRYMVEVIGR